MRKFITGILAFITVCLMIGLHPDRCDTQAAQSGLAGITVNKIILMPFLTGKLEFPNQPIAKPLSTPFSQIKVVNQGLEEGADIMLPRIVNDNLKKRFQERLISPAPVTETDREVSGEAALDTPRKRAVRLGEALGWMS